MATKMRLPYWGNVRVQTDIPNTIEGGWLYVDAKVRPAWWWAIQRVRLFLSIVWRRWDADCTRIDWRTAWDVSKVAKGLTRKEQA